MIFRRLSVSFSGLQWDLDLETMSKAFKEHEPDAKVLAGVAGRIFLGLLAAKTSVRLPLSDVTLQHVRSLFTDTLPKDVNTAGIIDFIKSILLIIADGDRQKECNVEHTYRCRLSIVRLRTTVHTDNTDRECVLSD